MWLTGTTRNRWFLLLTFTVGHMTNLGLPTAMASSRLLMNTRRPKCPHRRYQLKEGRRAFTRRGAADIHTKINAGDPEPKPDKKNALPSKAVS